MIESPEKSQPELKPKHKPYKKINGITHCPSIQQITTIIIFTVEFILQVLYVLPMLLPWEFVSSIFLYLLLTASIVLYVYLTLYDPVDKLVVHPVPQPPCQPNPQSSSPLPLFTSKHCPHCDRQVGLASKHCHVCRRCCADFDHHCNYLNNCIGDCNYKQFLALVAVATIYQCLLLAQSAFVLAKEFQGQGRREEWAVGRLEDGKWAVVVLAIMAGLVFGMQIALIILHGYLRCMLNLSTYQWIKADRKEKKGREAMYEMASVLPNSASTQQESNAKAEVSMNV